MAENLKQKIFFSALVLISITSSVGAIIYRLYSFNFLGVFLSLTLIIAIFYFYILNYQKTSYGINDIEEKHKKLKKIIFKKETIVIVSFYSLFFLSCFIILLKSRTNESLISPWSNISKTFFLFYALATASLILAVIKKIPNCIIMVMAHFFLSLSVLWIVFKIGYGYDPFIHRATIGLIEKKGSVDPKPFYYLGQYSLIFLTHKLTFIPISFLDKILVPLLSSIFIPGSIYLFLKKKLIIPLSKKQNIEDKNIKQVDKSSMLIAVTAFLALPFCFFAITTPQNLAFLFLIIVVFLGLMSANENKEDANLKTVQKDIKKLVLPGLLSVSALLTHPVAGIVAVLFVIFLAIYCLPYHKIKKVFYSIIFLIVILSLPASFYFAEKSLGKSAPANKEISSNINILPFVSAPKFPNEENFILNFSYFFYFNYWIILAALIISALIFSYRKRVENREFFIAASFFICLFISYFLTRSLDFNFLINYERDDYSSRILTTAIIFLLPAFSIIFFEIIERIKKENKKIKISFLCFFIIILAASVYINYPRQDNFYNSHGYSVGKTDLLAVDFVEKDANKEPYIALANQQVSVAALWRFGFNRYYKNNEIYFYPIPTGGELYQYYLKMVYEKPTKKTMEEAMNLAGVNKAYFIINKYWWAFDKIVEEAKLEANFFSTINNNEIYIFKYVK